MKLYLQANGSDRWIALRPVCDFLHLDFERETYLIMAEEYFQPHLSTKTFSIDGEPEAEHLGMNEQGFTAWIFMKQNASKYPAEYKPVWDCYLKVYAYLREQENAYIELLKKWKKVGKDKRKQEERDAIIDSYLSFERIQTMNV
jgi:hypothetical protein